MARGQPMSMANVRALHQLCDRRGIKVYLDAMREEHAELNSRRRTREP
jgi:tryptophanase